MLATEDSTCLEKCTVTGTTPAIIVNSIEWSTPEETAGLQQRSSRKCGVSAAKEGIKVGVSQISIIL
jgi:hypothetical protein